MLGECDDGVAYNQIAAHCCPLLRALG